MFKGTIEEYSGVQGIGTIMREDGKCFPFHISSVRDPGEDVLSAGHTVFFDIGKSMKGLEAIYVLIAANYKSPVN
jgi:cold shock CspA family protein